MDCFSKKCPLANSCNFWLTFMGIVALSVEFSFPDVDECAGSHGCNQVCINTLGSYNCSCEEDFVLSADSRTCLPSCNATYTALSGSYQTPGWPVSYPRYNFACLWTIDLQEDDNYAIHFSVDSTAYGILGRPPCPTEYLEFHDGLTRNTPSLGKFCFITVPDDVVTSSGQALVVFKAIDFNRPPSRKGARITYEAFRIGIHLSLSPSE